MVGISTIVTPETLLAWHCKLIASKYDGSDRRKPGRPRLEAPVEDLIVRMAQENRTWGYDRIQGALQNVGHRVSATTIADVLRRRGIEPAPERKTKTTWKEFLNRHRDQIVATDFFTIEVWTKAGLQRFMVLFFIELSTRRVHLGGITKSPNGLWMEQIARTITDCENGVMKNSRYLIHDRDPLFTAAFLETLKQSGMDSVKLPPRSPNLNVTQVPLSAVRVWTSREDELTPDSFRNSIWLNKIRQAGGKPGTGSLNSAIRKLCS